MNSVCVRAFVCVPVARYVYIHMHTCIVQALL